MTVVGWILLAVLVLGILPTMVMSYVIFHVLLVRDKEEKWGQDASMPEDEEYVRLYAQAREWRETWADRRREAGIENDGLKLYGEYYDFGSDRAVIILPGRMESCTYSCHYAEPYRKAGWNVLTIDTRSHGRSEGKYNSLGYREYRDVLAWARFLHEKQGIRQVVLHGICIGSSTAVFAAGDPACPAYVTGVVADGMYQRFFDSFRNHMIKDRRPLFPFLWETMIWIRVFCGADVVWDGPFKRIRKVRLPILFLHSRKDPFSTPEKAQELFDWCPSERKTMEWFPSGGHSRLRITWPEQYDAAVEKFLAGL